MRIGIDARKLHDFGIGTYIRNLLRQLARDWIAPTEFVLLCRPDDREGLAALGENFRPVAETAGNYSVSEQLRIPLALMREKASRCSTRPTTCSRRSCRAGPSSRSTTAFI